MSARPYLSLTRLTGYVLGPRVTVTAWLAGSCGISGERADATKGSGSRWSWWSPRLEQVKPVACFIHSDLAPRSAVRTVGPRPDLTRSARMDEPGGMAIRPGDQNRGLTAPYRAAYQPTGGRWEKNGGSDATTSTSPYVGRPSSHD